MNHWFDDFTRGLARPSLSRRALLASALKAGVAGAATAILGQSRVLTEFALGNNPPQRNEGPCDIRQEGRVRITSFSAKSSYKGKPLTFEQTTRKTLPRGDTKISKIITLDNHPLLRMETIRRAGSTEVTIDYGEALQNKRRASFRSNDDKVITGVIEGRRIRAFRVGEPQTSIRFEDNRPPPQVKVDTELSEAVRSLLEQAQKSAATCSASRFKRAHAKYTITPAYPQGESGHDSSPETSGGCFGCEGACTAVATGCAIAAGVACAASLGLACGALAACGVAEVACIAACHANGAPCCPVNCGDVACCDNGETCLNANIGVCCSKGLIGCANKHCCNPTDTCINATGFCCPKAQNVCNHVCCKPGEVCKDGVTCCPATQVVCAGVCCKKGETCVNNKKCCKDELSCGKVCCDELSRCVDANKSTCCAFAVQDCNGICCKLGEHCINGKCCSKPCGSLCCGPDKECQNGICISILCPTGKVTCVSNDGTNTQGAAICCPPKVACCLGKCCKSGEGCCSGPGTPFGCHNLSQCIA